MVSSTLGPLLAQIPVWETVVALSCAGAAAFFALRKPPAELVAAAPETDDAAIAVITEVQGVDRGLSVHANGVVTLAIVAAGANATIIQTNGGPGMPLMFATTIALLTGLIIATTAFALEGGATAAAALPSTELCATAQRNLRRVHRRLQCVRVATWCLVPIVLLVVLSIVHVRN